MKNKIWRSEKDIKPALTPIEKMNMIYKWIDISCNNLKVELTEECIYKIYLNSIIDIDKVCYRYVYDIIEKL